VRPPARGEVGEGGEDVAVDAAVVAVQVAGQELLHELPVLRLRHPLGAARRRHVGHGLQELRPGVARVRLYQHRRPPQGVDLARGRVVDDEGGRGRRRDEEAVGRRDRARGQIAGHPRRGQRAKVVVRRKRNAVAGGVITVVVVVVVVVVAEREGRRGRYRGVVRVRRELLRAALPSRRHGRTRSNLCSSNELTS